MNFSLFSVKKTGGNSCMLLEEDLRLLTFTSLTYGYNMKTHNKYTVA